MTFCLIDRNKIIPKTIYYNIKPNLFMLNDKIEQPVSCSILSFNMNKFGLFVSLIKFCTPIKILYYNICYT